MLLLYLVTASSHILYYYIWNYPEDFIDFTYSYNVKPVIFMSRICYLQKCLQWYLILLNSYYLLKWICVKQCWQIKWQVKVKYKA